MKKKVVSALATATILSAIYTGTAFANTYTIQKGDSLSKIATKYHTSVLELTKLNSLRSDSIRIGAVIKVPDPVSKPAPKVPASAVKIYTVVKGDTLAKIASHNGTSIANLVLWNKLSTTIIYAGQKLNVSAVKVETAKPGPKTTEKTESKPKESSKPKPVVPPSSSTTDQTKGEITVIPTVSAEYVVKTGDSLGKIGLQFNMTVADLKKLNKLSSDVIYVGQTLKVTNAVPVVEATNTTTTVIQEAKNLMGVPYVWGGSTNAGLDCSGFIYYVQNKAGISVGRYSADGYYNHSYFVDKPQAGDLVFFENTYKVGISHMGIYLGDNSFIHADEVHGVTITSLDSAYYQEHFAGFKRFY
ncbi:LysM peptidoglycan-binding domain-containing protein [Neobacillus sp. PS3-40]|uniref:C40 family peptidase n=1 Tax=Neobacillus sp. PS3-40 TaxID=3070679 RepID=UPI0027E13BF1|nr:LysM peptidoglycan-binding domain-containing protein [Neobacillus sp. PS3-40]WML46204.1 LysM peptidoglycan-binding domain-containing protein [Neobacillus sp. PS3-40]